LIDHVNALLYKSDAELEEKILTLIRDGELSKRIGENARQMVNAHTWERRVEALTSLYQHYLGREENG
jgi:glycosyltransferase involved in cell wall biosynthesis